MDKSVMKQHIKKIGIGAAALLMVFSVSFAGSYFGEMSAHEDNDKGELTQTTQLESVTSDVSVVAASAASSIVAITTETMTTGNYMQQYVSEGAGSGVIISEEGYIITNQHVIEDASTIMVKLNNDEEYEAQLIGYDASVDIAVIKIDAKDLTTAAIGNSETIAVGESVVAIGNPLGELGGTVTEGIISATSRQLTIDNQEMTLLQTSAAINPGNSGGGLFNMAGELIGIVNAKSSGSDIEGLGFAIPINTAKDVAQQIIETEGNVSTNATYVLGITMLEIDSEELLKQYNLEKQGVYVYEVLDNSEAYSLGIQSGDLLISINDVEVKTAESAQTVIKEIKNEDVLNIVVERNGKEILLSMTVNF